MLSSPWLDLIFLAGMAGIIVARLTRLRSSGLVVGSLAYLLGSLCNVIVVAANGWKMPGPRNSPGYIAIDASTRLSFLGDQIKIVGHANGFTGHASIGDFLVWSGELAIVLAFVHLSIITVRRRFA